MRRALVAALAATLGCAKPPVEAAPEHWCPEGLEHGHGDVCFALPAEHTSGAPVLVYLHGALVGRGAPEEWAAARVALARGYAVVVPRGQRGACAWKVELREHFCWPDGGDAAAVRAVVDEWSRTVWQVEALMDGAARGRYVLGREAGADFAAVLAQGGYFTAAGFALLDGTGGSVGGEPPANRPRPPVLRVGARLTPTPLDRWLAAHGWPASRCARAAGTDHVRDAELALRFFRGELRDAAYTCESR